MFSTGTFSQQRADLSGLSFCIDPGHSQSENVGIYGYPEAWRNLDVAFQLEEFLESSNADTVVLTRRDRVTQVSVSQRPTIANNANVSWFHSIHSNAWSDPSLNYVLVLVEERREYSDNRQLPDNSRGKGLGLAYWAGKADVMAGIMSSNIAKGYRTQNRGVFLDWTFYGGANGGYNLGVFRPLLMPGELSEAGFHTNPKQNLLNMNWESKRVEAKVLWFAFLQYFNVPRPSVNTVCGIITNARTGKPINGAIATLLGRTYTTNTYQNTFSQWTTDTTVSNGFYYFDGIPPGTYSLTVSAPGFSDTTLQVAVISTFFTFQDVTLLPKTTAVREDRGSTPPVEYALLQNYPNPFNPTTSIEFQVSSLGFASLKVFDMLGCEVKTLVNENLSPDSYKVIWDGRDDLGQQVSSGIYVCRLVAYTGLGAGTFVASRRMALIR